MNDDFNENKDIQDNIDMPLKDDNDNKSEEKQSKDEKSINLYMILIAGISPNFYL